MNLTGLTLAVTRMDEMVAFYNAVFETNLEPSIEIEGQQFYRGKLLGLELTLCPNVIAGVVAEQNRQQFRFQVDNIEVVMANGLQNHGREVDAVTEHNGAKVASLADPDGNTIEFIQMPL